MNQESFFIKDVNCLDMWISSEVNGSLSHKHGELYIYILCSYIIHIFQCTTHGSFFTARSKTQRLTYTQHAPALAEFHNNSPQSLTKPNEKTPKTRPKAMEKLNDQKFLDEAQARSGSLEERVCRTKQLD